MKFEDRAVAFIDILGFRHLVGSAVSNKIAFQKLEELIGLLSTAVPTLDATVESSVPRHLIPTHTYISDCIILSAPINDHEITSYNGLEIVVMRAIQLSHFFLRYGYLVRGGISAGKVWHTESNIVGPAYQEAYELEEKGDKPYIVITNEAIKHWRGGSRMCLQDGEVSFVNGLFDFYIPNNTEHGVIEETYKNYAATVENVLNSDIKESAKEKWKWFKGFLESESKEGMKWSQA